MDPFLTQGGFARPVPPDGYAWWYVDAISDCGNYGLTIIVFIGSVFSPYYAWARRRGPADPFDHCAVNVALYGKRTAWTMTERKRGDVTVRDDRIDIGGSSARWIEGELVIELAERTMPGFRPLRGTVRVTPRELIDHEVTLDATGRHRWRPFAPQADVEVRLDAPSLSWSGRGYFDSNHGDEPLERGFRAWSWSRMSAEENTLVLYEAQRRDGTSMSLARVFGNGITDVVPPEAASLPRGLWGVARPTRADAGTTPRLVRRFEDAPFYTRSEISSEIGGRVLHGVHESLDLDRFVRPVVQMMLPFRMPRRGFS